MGVVGASFVPDVPTWDASLAMEEAIASRVELTGTEILRRQREYLKETLQEQRDQAFWTERSEKVGLDPERVLKDYPPGLTIEQAHALEMRNKRLRTSQHLTTQREASGTFDGSDGKRLLGHEHPDHVHVEAADVGQAKMQIKRIGDLYTAEYAGDSE